MKNKVRIQLPRWARRWFDPKRYKVAKGGRGSAKSHTIARMLLLISANKKKRILCTREYQNSIADSVHKLFKDIIADYDLRGFTVTNTSIIHENGSEFMFYGLNKQIQSIKSMEGIDICWVEEGQVISKKSWEILIPTIRKSGSEIWVSYNPHLDDDPTHVMFAKTTNADVLVDEVNWNDNPWFPEELRKEKDRAYANDPEGADNIWGGKTLKHSAAQIMKGKWCIESFEPNDYWDGPYLGADFGFNDPLTLVKCYIFDDTLYIRNEAGGPEIDLPDIPDVYDKVPQSRNYLIRGDNSRPETISYIRSRGFNIISCKKWDGCVEEGISFIRGFKKVVIHPDCPSTADEFKLYSYKVDRLTLEVTNTIVDKNNHYIDAIRYALEPFITKKASLFDQV